MTVKAYDREALKAARLAGATVAELMVVYDCSESVIRTRLHRMGVKLPAKVALARATANLKAWRANPDNEARRQAGVARQWTPERRKLQGEMGRASIAARLAWCPPERLADHHRLVRSKRLSTAESRRIIEADIARDRAVEDAKPRRRRSFDELMAAIAAGEPVNLITLPSPARVEPMFSPIGCALA